MDAIAATKESRTRALRRLYRGTPSDEERTERALAIARTFGKNPPEMLAETRDYKGAAVNSTNWNWVGSTRSVDAEMQYSSPMMRSRGRDLEENNPYAERYLAELEANVLGPEGMMLQMQVQEWSPNAPGEPTDDGGAVKGAWVADERANDLIESAWYRFRQQGQCDVTGELSLHDVERLMLRGAARDGHILCRFVPQWENESGIAVQILESDALDTNYNASLPNGNFVKLGVEMDAWRRRVAYHILTTHPGEYFLNRPATGQPPRIRVEARDIIHLRFLRRPDQTIGVSWFAPVMGQMEMLAGYEEAEVTSARAEACKGGFLYSDVVPEGGFIGASPDPTGMKRLRLSPGEIRGLPYGVKYQANNPTHPNGNYEGFRKGVLRGIASGLGTSYNILANDLQGVNYSSLRGGLLDEREIYKMLQTWFATRFETQLFTRWLESAMLTRAVPLPFYRFDKFNAPYFQGRRWAWVDPVKDIEAVERAIALGLTSLRSEASSLGRYVVDIAKEQKADAELAKRYGLKWGALRNKPSGEQPAKEDEPTEPAPNEETPNP